MKNPAAVCFALLLMATAFAGRPAFAKHSLYPACGTVARDGRFAAAVPSAGGLALEISGADGSIEKLRLTLAAGPEQCRLAFDQNGEYLAVGVREGNRAKTWLHIRVFNTHAKQWTSSFRIQPEPGMPFPRRFEGFLQRSSTLVVTGYARGTDEKPEKSEVRVALFSPDGRLLQPIIARSIPDSYFNWDTDFADAAHNRLWFNHDPQFCPLSSTSLTGPENYGPTIDANVVGHIACDLPDALGFPSTDILVGASTRSDRTWVWRVDLAAGRGEKLELPQAQRGPLVRADQYQTLGGLPVSADAQIFAVPRAVIAWDIFDHPHFGGGAVYIFRVRPFRLLGVIKGKKGCGPAGVAVGDTGGRPEILSHQCGGGWKLVPVPLSSPD